MLIEYYVLLTTESPHGGILFDIWNITVPSMVPKIQMEIVFDKISAKLTLVSSIAFQGIGIQDLLNNTYSVPFIFIFTIDSYPEWVSLYTF